MRILLSCGPCALSQGDTLAPGVCCDWCFFGQIQTGVAMAELGSEKRVGVPLMGAAQGQYSRALLFRAISF